MQDKNNQSTIRLLLTSTFFLWFSVYTYPSFLSVYAQGMGATPVMVGSIVGSYGLTQMLLRIPLGVYSDIIRKRKPFMVLGMVASMVSAIGLFAFRSPVAALIFRGMAGVAASTWVTFSVMYSSQFPVEKMSMAMGRISTAQYGSQLLAMLLGSYLAQNVGTGAAFLLAAAGGLAGMFVVLAIRDTPPVTPPQTIAALVGVAKNKRLLSATGLAVLFQFVCWGTVLGFTANWAKGVVGLDMAQLGMLSAMYLIPNTFIPRFSSGILTDKLGQRRVMMIGFGTLAVACALFTQAFNIVTLFSAQALFGIGMSFIMPLTIANAISDISQEKRGAAMGFYQSIYGMGMFVGPVVAGSVIDAFSTGENLVAGYTANFLLMAALALAGVLLTMFLIPKQDK